MVSGFHELRTIVAADDPATAGLNESEPAHSVVLKPTLHGANRDPPPQLVQTTPVGNRFVHTTHSLASANRLLGNPQDVAIGDFNGDSWPDVAVAIFDGNAVSILINDQSGGFLPTIDIPLAPPGRAANQPRGTGPIALVAGRFNASGGEDLAVANSFSSNVAILLDLTGKTFASEKYVDVGLIPPASPAATCSRPPAWVPTGISIWSPPTTSPTPPVPRRTSFAPQQRARNFRRGRAAVRWKPSRRRRHRRF
jgi:hypothetical protein